jgi:hypothetical protein
VVSGFVQVVSTKPSPKDNFVGTLKDNKLSFKAGTRSADLVYDGTMMSGSGFGSMGGGWDLLLPSCAA